MRVRSLSLKVALPLAVAMTVVTITIATVGADYRLRVVVENAPAISPACAPGL